MKKMLLFIVVAFSVTQLWSQNASMSSGKSKSDEDRNFRIPLIGENAPSFTAESTNGTIKFPEDFGRYWKVLFSHPQDFTPVCSTEILELAHLQPEFDKLGVKLVVVSTDLLDTHVQWKKSLESLDLNNRGLVKIKFPLVDDNDKSVAKKYGMIHAATNSTESVRGVFIIDPDDVVKAIFFYPRSVGRNTDELIRTITALQTTYSEKVMTPVNWKAGNDLLVPTPPKTDAHSNTSVPEGYYSPIWYLWFKKTNQKNEGMFQSGN
jgi:peroxiredoxin (alkyl hydroperoxide reductase subunit C)